MSAARPARMHIGSLLQDIAARRQTRPALIDRQGALTWSEFGQRLRRIAHALFALGLRHGDRVALLVRDPRRYLEMDYGVMSAGLVRVPIDTRMPRADIFSILNASGARALIASGDLMPDAVGFEAPDLEFRIAYGNCKPGDVDFEALIANSPAEGLPEGEPGDLATLNYSGGTTGAPKGIALQHGALCAVFTQTIDAFAIRSDVRFLNVRPLWPIAQVVLMAHLAAGGTVILDERFDAAAFAERVQSSAAQRTSLVPTQLFRVLEHLRPNDPRLACLEAIYIGGSRLPLELFHRAIEKIGPRIGVLYGMTEAPISCYLAPAIAASSESAMLSVGSPVEGCEVKVAGPDGPTDERAVEGEVLIRGAHVMRGYWRNPEASAVALRGDWLHTGDLGAFDEEQRLRIVGRLKEVIRTGAQSVIPAEVEDALITHPAVAEVAVVGLPDEEWGEAVTAFVVLKRAIKADEAALIRHCESRLASFKKPRAVRFVQALPRSHYGKVLKAQLIAEASHEQGR